MTHDVPAQTTLFATNVGASVWWASDLFYRHGPSWEIVPPILIGGASLLGAMRGMLNDRQARRHKDELHKVEVEKRRGKA